MTTTPREARLLHADTCATWCGRILCLVFAAHSGVSVHAPVLRMPTLEADERGCVISTRIYLHTLLQYIVLVSSGTGYRSMGLASLYSDFAMPAVASVQKIVAAFVQPLQS